MSVGIKRQPYVGGWYPDYSLRVQTYLYCSIGISISSFQPFLVGSYHKTMTTRYFRQQQSETHDEEFTPWTLQQIHKSQINARMHQVEMSSISEGRVTEGQCQLALQHCVNLHHGTCTCHLYSYIRILDFRVNMHWLVSYISNEHLSSIFRMIYQ